MVSVDRARGRHAARPPPGKAMTALSTSASILVESQRSQAGHRAEVSTVTPY
jgi:hypothetical protein